MSSFSGADAGRFNLGDIDLDKAWETLAGGIVRAGRDDTPAVNNQAPRGPVAASVDEELSTYLDRSAEPFHPRFPPYEKLSARLNELAPQPPEATKPPPQDAPKERRNNRKPTKVEARVELPLPWFETKFEELKAMLEKGSANNEVIALNEKLAGIVDRVDQLSAAIPSAEAISSLETRLTSLSQAIAESRTQSSEDSNRISRAAREIFETAERIENARHGFEATARGALVEIDRAITSSAAATIAHISKAVPDNSIYRVEEELRNLNALSRETSERATAAIERVHETLRDFLEGDREMRQGAATAPKKRVSVTTPISARVPAYVRSPRDFGGSPESQGLDRLLYRAFPEDSHEDAHLLREEDEVRSAPEAALPHRNRRAPAAPARGGAAQRSSTGRDDERGFPIIGLAAVALLLLLASAALYYLHNRGSGSPEIAATVIEEPAAPAKNEQPAKPEIPASEIALTRSVVWPEVPVELPSLNASGTQNGGFATKLEDSSEELQRLAEAAQRGDREAQYRIGSRLLTNASLQGGAQSAARWLSRAAQQGHVESQFLLATIYERGTGLDRNLNEAIEWYRRAASAGHTGAMHNLAVLIATTGHPRYAEAAGWFAKAASHGVTDSQYNLALLKERGLGIAKDEPGAFFWYSVAALSGDKDAKIQAERLRQLLKQADAERLASEAAAWKPSDAAATASGAVQS